jgi:uncharacterized protein (TIGR03435 family)
VDLLSQGAEIPVLDETGLDGKYDFVLEWDPKLGAFGMIKSIEGLGISVQTTRRPVAQLFLRLRSQAVGDGAGVGALEEAAAGAAPPQGAEES